MKIKPITFGANALAGLLAATTAYGLCDNKRASTGTKHCYTPKVGEQIRCVSVAAKDLCLQDPKEKPIKITIAKFPLECTSEDGKGYNCSLNLSDCWATTKCEWDAEKGCLEVQGGASKFWHQALKPTMVKCELDPG